MKKTLALMTAAALMVTAGCAASGQEKKAELQYWTADSEPAQILMDYVEEVCNASSPDYVPPEERIAVFDVDGTLIGERFPTYFDQCVLMHRLLHDEGYQPPAEARAFAEELEEALLNGEPEPDSPRSSTQMAAEAFKGLTVEEYRQYVRDFMSTPAVGFDGLTYGDGFFKPMVSVVDYLADNDFQIFICSGAERNLVRELIKEPLGEWIPPYHVIGSIFSLTAPGQGDKEDRSYTYAPDDKVLLEGNMVYKNAKMAKVNTIVNEIGCTPTLAFGNSSGDFAMGNYTIQNGGMAFMLLCDDTEREYGDLEEAQSFAQECEALGFVTVSMQDDFETIYGENVTCSAVQAAVS